MPVKREKLEQLIKKLLKDSKDSSSLTVRTVKRAIEDELGLDSGDLDTQTDVVKEILIGELEEQGEAEADPNTTQTEKPSTKRKSEEEGEAEEKVAEKEEKGADEAEEEEEKPKAKKVKRTVEKPIAKKGASTTKTTGQENEDGQLYFELHELKRVTIKDWKNQNHVDLRNFWRTNNGDIAPTQKGVMLTKAQWKILKDNVGKIDEMIQNK